MCLYLHHPEWCKLYPQGISYALGGRIGKVVATHAEGCKVARSAVAELHRCMLCTRRSGGTAHEGGGGATSQLDLPSLTPLFVAGCGRLQLGVPHCASSVITASS